MPIPELNADGYLPQGIHNATLEEVGAVFGGFHRTERRILLFQRLCEYIAQLRSLGNAAEVLINGSSASAKADPGDIDMIVVYPADFNFTAQITPAEYNMIDRRRVRRVYGFRRCASCAAISGPSVLD